MNLNEITLRVAKAREALDSMDDFARMADIDAIGARKVLTEFIELIEELAKESEPVAECVRIREGYDNHDYKTLVNVPPFGLLYLHPAIPAPLPDEVRELVDRLRSYHICTVTNNEAADMIERLAANSIPEGWQLVPKEPTDGMLDAASQVDCSPDWMLRAEYKAMLAAAPKP